MKNLIVIISVFLSVSTFASCEQETYTLVINDYDSSMNESCHAFVKEAMIQKGCSADEIAKQSLSAVRSINVGSSYMCVVESQSGIYQVMASQMAEPNIVSILYSRYD